MCYDENFWGIRFKAERGKELEITANSDSHYLACWGGVLNIMSKDLCGRTATFANDCSFFSQTDEKIIIKVMPGTGSYMKELNRVRPVSRFESENHQLGKLW